MQMHIRFIALPLCFLIFDIPCLSQGYLRAHLLQIDERAAVNEQLGAGDVAA